MFGNTIYYIKKMFGNIKIATNDKHGYQRNSRLSCLVLAAALVAMVGTVVVEFDFDLGLDEFTVARQTELHVLDVRGNGSNWV
jgi:hypothetical protein